MTTKTKAIELADEAIKLASALDYVDCSGSSAPGEAADLLRESADELRRLSALEQQGEAWVKASDRVPLESDGEVFVRFTDGSIGTGWATYWHGSSNDFARWTFPDPDEFRMVSEWAKNIVNPAADLTDEQIVAVMRDGYNCRYNDEADHIDFARAIIANVKGGGV